MSRITDIAKTMKTWWNEDDDPFVHRALNEIIRIDQEQLSTIEPKKIPVANIHINTEELLERIKEEYELEPKQGKWIKTTPWSYGSGMGEVYGYYQKCSNCGKEFMDKSNFCPNCGADMREKEGER